MVRIASNKMPEGTAQVDFVTLIVHPYCDILLRYVCSVIFCGAVVLKVSLAYD